MSLTRLLDLAIAVPAVRAGNNGRSLEQHDLFAVLVFHNYQRKAHKAFWQGGHGGALEVTVAGQQRSAADHCGAHVADGQAVNHQFLVFDRLDEVFLVLDMAIGGDVPVIGSQQGLKGRDVASHDRFGIQSHSVGLGLSQTGGKAKNKSEDKRCGFKKFHSVLRRYAEPSVRRKAVARRELSRHEPAGKFANGRTFLYSLALTVKQNASVVKLHLPIPQAFREFPYDNMRFFRHADQHSSGNWQYPPATA